MADQLQFIPPDVAFNPHAAELLFERFPLVEQGQPVQAGAGAVRRSPFEGYARMLTAEGGLLIHYKDQNLTLICKVIRFLTASTVGIMGLWAIVRNLDLTSGPGLLVLGLLALLIWLIAIYKVPSRHTVEIRPDGMIIDGKDIFFADDIGDNWPELQQKDDAGQFVIAGICGTRFIEYMTANRMDENDRTPEVLAADLQQAMEQLWGRREVTFPEAY